MDTGLTLKNGALPKKNALLLLSLLLILGFGLRFYGLENQSLWNDELSSWRRSSYDSLFAVINKGARPDVHPPGYYALLYFVQRYVGDSESVLRFPSALSGTLSIFVIFLVGLRLYSYEEGIIASALMTVLWCPIYYSQEARAYSTLLLFTLLSTYFWISILSSLDETGRLSGYTVLGYIITAIISSYLHYFGLYSVVLQALGAVLFLARRRQTLACILLIYFPILLAYLPWWPAMLKDLGRGAVWIKPPPSNAFFHYLEFLFNRSVTLLLVVLTLYSFLLLRSLYDIVQRNEYESWKITLSSPGWLLVLWLVVPFVGVYVESVLSTPVLTFRNLIISLPAAYLLLSRSITRLPLCPRNQVIITFVLVSLFFSHLVFSMNYYSQPHKQQFREAVGYVVERDSLYEDSLIVGYRVKAYLDYYFERKRLC